MLNVEPTKQQQLNVLQKVYDDSRGVHHKVIGKVLYLSKHLCDKEPLDIIYELLHDAYDFYDVFSDDIKNTYDEEEMEQNIKSVLHFLDDLLH